MKAYSQDLRDKVINLHKTYKYRIKAISYIIFGIILVVLAISNQITDWKQHHNHEAYFLELSTQHKRKTSFWAGYQTAIAKQKQKEAKILKDKS